MNKGEEVRINTRVYLDHIENSTFLDKYPRINLALAFEGSRLN